MLDYLLGVLSTVILILLRQLSEKRYILQMAIQVPADAQLNVSLNLVVKDIRGNVVSSGPVSVDRVEEINPVGNWGSVSVDEDEPTEIDLRFQDAGSTVTLRAFTTVNEEEKSFDFDLEVVAGAPAITELNGELVTDID